MAKEFLDIGGVSSVWNAAKSLFSKKIEVAEAVNDAKQLTLENIVLAPSDFTLVTTDCPSGYPYRATIANSNIDETDAPDGDMDVATMELDVIYPKMQTFNGGIYVYASAVPTQSCKWYSIRCFRAGYRAGTNDGYVVADLTDYVKESETETLEDEDITQLMVESRKRNLGSIATDADYLTTTLKQLALDVIYPVGITVGFKTDIDPNVQWGGTWVRCSQGRAVVGVDENDPDFVAGKTGGSKTHTLTINEMPSHTHTQRLGNENGVTAMYRTNMSGKYSGFYINNSAMPYASTAVGTGVTTQNTGGSKPHDIMSPYETEYRWTRTA